MRSYFSRSLLTSLVKGGVLFLTAIAVAAAARFFEVDSFQDPVWIESHLRQGPQGVAAFVAIAAVCSALGFPRQALAFLGGYAFGAAAGLAWTSLALALGCACGFHYSRFLGRTLIQKRLGGRIKTIDSFLCRSPFLMAVTIRLFPLGNNALTNMAAGVSSIPALPFVAGSAIGYLPQTLVFVLLGSGVQVGAELRIFVSALLFAGTSFIGLRLFQRFKAEREDGAGRRGAPPSP